MNNPKENIDILIGFFIIELLVGIFLLISKVYL